MVNKVDMADGNIVSGTMYKEIVERINHITSDPDPTDANATSKTVFYNY